MAGIGIQDWAKDIGANSIRQDWAEDIGGGSFKCRACISARTLHPPGGSRLTVSTTMAYADEAEAVYNQLNEQRRPQGNKMQALLQCVFIVPFPQVVYFLFPPNTLSEGLTLCPGQHLGSSTAPPHRLTDSCGAAGLAASGWVSSPFEI